MNRCEFAGTPILPKFVVAEAGRGKRHRPAVLEAHRHRRAGAAAVAHRVDRDDRDPCEAITAALEKPAFFPANEPAGHLVRVGDRETIGREGTALGRAPIEEWSDTGRGWLSRLRRAEHRDRQESGHQLRHTPPVATMICPPACLAFIGFAFCTRSV